MRTTPTRLALSVAAVVGALCFASHVHGDPEPEYLATAEGLVAELYRSVTFEADVMPDWQKVRGMFLANAVIVLRTSRDSTKVFSVDGFIDDFVGFIEAVDAGKTGFTERVMRTTATVFGDMAHVLVLYETSIPGSPRPPQQGVDSFQLVRRNGRWWILSVTNEIPTPDNPLPATLRD